MDQHLFPPEYLIRIMAKYYLVEEVHLSYYYGPRSGSDDTGRHWKIDAFDIIA